MNVSHENDYCFLAKTNADRLRQDKWTEVDVIHLIEELDDVGKSEHRSLEGFVKKRAYALTQMAVSIPFSRVKLAAIDSQRTQGSRQNPAR